MVVYILDIDDKNKLYLVSPPKNIELHLNKQKNMGHISTEGHSMKYLPTAP